MNRILKALYDAFYDLIPKAEPNQEVEACPQQFIESLDNPRQAIKQLIVRFIGYITYNNYCEHPKCY